MFYLAVSINLLAIAIFLNVVPIISIGNKTTITHNHYYDDGDDEDEEIELPVFPYVEKSRKN